MSLLFPFTTLSFAYPAVFLIPIILAAGLLIPKRVGEIILVPEQGSVSALASGWKVALRTPLLTLGAGLGILLLTVAAARPQKITVLPAEREARNLMLIVDVSRSMEIDDIDGQLGSLSRMDALKLVLADFVKARKGDRIGIVVFGQQAFLQAPLTTDHEFLTQLIDQIHPRMAGDGTAMGEGLGVGLRRIQDVATEARAMILITDGVSNAGNVNPLQAAKVAKDLGITVHTIGIGSYSPVDRSGFGGFFGMGGGQAEFDEKGLREIADLTGGIYRNAGTLTSLQDIYTELDKVERTKEEEPERRLVQELFAPYLSAALLALFLTSILSRSLFLRTP